MNKKNLQVDDDELMIKHLSRARLLVLGVWPGCMYEVGQLVDPDLGDQRPRDFPALFRWLDWYERRKIVEMPRYLKRVSDNNPYRKVGENAIEEVVEVSEWSSEVVNNAEGQELSRDFTYFRIRLLSEDEEVRGHSLVRWFPATEQEYNYYIAKKHLSSKGL